jgi:putative PIG3 family NAD(P)H quinone oxidoreductase
MADAVPETMTCVEIPKPGGPEALALGRRPVPKPGANEVLVRVAAAGVNRADVMLRTGNYPLPPGSNDIPGLEIAGTVAALGQGVAGWSAGDSLCALVAGGGYAEFAAAPAPQCLPVPKGLGAIEAASLPEAYFTVWLNVFELGRLKAGETLLVHGGSSGIGTAAIQLAARLGARVVATAGSDEKCRACERLGAARAVNYRKDDFVEAALRCNGGLGVDVILDMVGGGYVERNIRALAPKGRLVNIAFMEGSKVELDLRPVQRKELTLTGSQLRPQSVEKKGALARAVRERVWPLIERGEIAAVVHAAFPLAEAAKAHRLMESSAHIGKIVLTV